MSTGPAVCALWPIYQTRNSVAAPSFAELVLLHSASRRGRDWFYAAAGACLVALMNLAFVKVGLSGAAIALLSATIFWVGLIPSRGTVAS